METLGAFGLSEYCQKLETLARQCNQTQNPLSQSETEKIYAQIQTEFEQVKTALQQELNSSTI
ncbi:MAG: hypothetical protein RSE13_17145 [Planktothrix sp. GU0601_MAG3]|nr:MAG: hypothetical protein RSE13_17145 [Planktothrix sp. GU0601_MAG3]